MSTRRCGSCDAPCEGAPVVGRDGLCGVCLGPIEPPEPPPETCSVCEHYGTGTIASQFVDVCMHPSTTMAEGYALTIHRPMLRPPLVCPMRLLVLAELRDAHNRVEHLAEVRSRTTPLDADAEAAMRRHARTRLLRARAGANLRYRPGGT